MAQYAIYWRDPGGGIYVRQYKWGKANKDRTVRDILKAFADQDASYFFGTYWKTITESIRRGKQWYIEVNWDSAGKKKVERHDIKVPPAACNEP